MTKIKTITLCSVIVLVLLLIGRLGGFKNPLVGAVILVLILLAYPIIWQIKQHIKKKYPDMIPSAKCPSCGIEISEDATHCHNCGTAIESEDEFIDRDEFTEDIKVKKICPYCGLQELETVYEVSRGYKEVCASCGKSRVSRKAIRITIMIIAYIVAIMLMFYYLFQKSLTQIVS